MGGQEDGVDQPSMPVSPSGSLHTKTWRWREGHSHSLTATGNQLKRSPLESPLSSLLSISLASTRTTSLYLGTEHASFP